MKAQFLEILIVRLSFPRSHEWLLKISRLPTERIRLVPIAYTSVCINRMSNVCRGTS